MFESENMEYETQNGEDVKPPVGINVDRVRANCCKGVPVNTLVVKDRNDRSFQALSTQTSPRNVKLFHKKRGSFTDGVAGRALPTIIGGSDLVPHKKRSRADEEGDGEERDDAWDWDDDYSTSLSNKNSSASWKEKPNGRVARETRVSSNLNQNSAERPSPSNDGNRLADEQQRRRKADDGARGIGTGGAGSDRLDNSRNEEGGTRSRPRRTIVSLF